MTVLFLDRGREGEEEAVYNALIVDGIRLAGLARVHRMQVVDAVPVSSASLVFMEQPGVWRERCIVGRRMIDTLLDVKRVWRGGRLLIVKPKPRVCTRG